MWKEFIFTFFKAKICTAAAKLTVLALPCLKWLHYFDSTNNVNNIIYINLVWQMSYMDPFHVTFWLFIAFRKKVFIFFSWSWFIPKWTSLGSWAATNNYFNNWFICRLFVQLSDYGSTVFQKIVNKHSRWSEYSVVSQHKVQNLRSSMKTEETLHINAYTGKHRMLDCFTKIISLWWVRVCGLHNLCLKMVPYRSGCRLKEQFPLFIA